MTEELEQVAAEEPAVEQPEASPEPEAPAAEATEEFTYDPDWLNEPDPTPQAPPAQEQQWSPEQVAAYNRQMQYYQQQQQARGYAPQAMPTAEDALNEFVRDPNAMISNVAGQAAQQAAAAVLQQSVAPVQQQMQAFIEGQANFHISAADERIKGLYKETFSKDETFANNQRVQKRVDDAIRGLREQAVWRARNGDPRGLAVFNDPSFAAVTLAAAKIIENTQPTSRGASAAPHVESTAPPVPKPDIEIDPDTMAAISKLGPDYVERYKNALRKENEG